MAERLRLPDGSLPDRVAVLRALQLGDLLVAVPALRALRRALPDAEIVLVGLPWAAELAVRFGHLLDGFAALPGYPGLPEVEPDPRALPGFLARMQARGFDAVIQMHGDGAVTNPLAVALGGRVTAGFFVPGRYCPDPDRFLPYPTDRPERCRLLDLAAFLGAPPVGQELEFPLGEGDAAELAAVAEAAGLEPGAYACLHPGARSAARRWPARRFAEVGDGLAARGLAVVLTGSASEAAVTAEVAGRMATPAVDLAGRTGLGAVGVLLAGARLLVSNDTGVSHVAEALGVPSVVLYLESDPKRWAPADAGRHRRVIARGGTRPSAGRVLEQADALLAAPWRATRPGPAAL
jgi:ADP-heptose:LPS heptosyltransferase